MATLGRAIRFGAIGRRWTIALIVLLGSLVTVRLAVMSPRATELLPRVVANTAMDPFFRNMSGTHLPIGAALSGNSMDAHPGDLDGDGDLDFIVAVEFGPNVVLINDGTGRFVDGTGSAMRGLSHDSEDVALADFDGDGDLDAVIVSEDDITDEQWMNDGSAGFSSVAFPSTGRSNAVIAVLLNDDTFPDLIVGNGGLNAVFINDGAGGWRNETAERLPPSVRTTQDLEWGDVDGDGDSDLVVANEDGNLLLLNDGAGVFTDVTAAALPMRPSGEETREADLGDIDGDGDLDLVFANVTFSFANPSGNRLLLNDGSGTFTDVSERFPSESRHTVDADFADLDGDLDLDLILANAFETSDAYQVLENDGSGVYTDVTDAYLPTGLPGSGIDTEVIDEDGDGFLDLIYLTGFRAGDVLLRRTTPGPSTPPPSPSSMPTEAPTPSPTVESTEEPPLEWMYLPFARGR